MGRFPSEVIIDCNSLGRVHAVIKAKIFSARLTVPRSSAEMPQLKEDSMSSTLTQQYLTSLNIKMLKRVLDTTGLFDVDNAWHREKRQDAARYLITAFQDGVHSEAALSASLMRQIKVFSSPSSPISITDPLQNDDERRWENEGGSMAFRHRPARILIN